MKRDRDGNEVAAPPEKRPKEDPALRDRLVKMQAELFTKPVSMRALGEMAASLADLTANDIKTTATNTLAASTTAVMAAKTTLVARAEVERLSSALPPWQDLPALYASLFPHASARGGVSWADAGAFFSNLWCDFTDTAAFWNGVMDLPPPPASGRAKAAAEAGGAEARRARPKAVDAEELRAAARTLEERPSGAASSSAGAGGDGASAATAEGQNADRNKEVGGALKRLHAGGKGEHVVVVKCADGPVRALLPMVRTLFDPWSYTQTIDNLFYFSYNVKRELAGVYWGVDGKPYVAQFDLAQAGARTAADAAAALVVAPEDPRYSAAVTQPAPGPLSPSSGSSRGGSSSSDGAGAGTSQFGLTIDMASWRLLLACEGIPIGAPDVPPLLPHRATRDTMAPRGYAFTA